MLTIIAIRISIIDIGIMHPISLPAFRRLPERVVGIPVALENLRFALEIPIARFQLNDNPGILRLRAIFNRFCYPNCYIKYPCRASDNIPFYFAFLCRMNCCHNRKCKYPEKDRAYFFPINHALLEAYNRTIWGALYDAKFASILALNHCVLEYNAAG